MHLLNKINIVLVFTSNFKSVCQTFVKAPLSFNSFTCDKIQTSISSRLRLSSVLIGQQNIHGATNLHGTCKWNYTGWHCSDGRSTPLRLLESCCCAPHSQHQIIGLPKGENSFMLMTTHPLFCSFSLSFTSTRHYAIKSDFFISLFPFLCSLLGSGKW